MIPLIPRLRRDFDESRFRTSIVSLDNVPYLYHLFKTVTFSNVYNVIKKEFHEL